MARTFGSLLRMTVSLLLLLVPVSGRAQPAAPTEVPLNLVALQVTHTLDLFNAEAAAGSLPKLSRVVFDFNTAATQGAGFSFNILIFKIGASRQATTTNEVTFTYAVPAPVGVLQPHKQPATTTSPSLCSPRCEPPRNR